MLNVLALALEIQQTNPKLPEEVRNQYAAWVVEEAESRDLDPWIFHGIIHTETRWKAGIIVHEQNGTCSIGLGGINVTCDSKRAKELRNPRENLKAMGSFLSTIRGRCAHHCAGLGWLRAYNGGDRDYVPKKIGPIVQRCHVAYDQQPVVPKAQGLLHPPWMCRQEDI